MESQTSNAVDAAGYGSEVDDRDSLSSALAKVDKKVADRKNRVHAEIQGLEKKRDAVHAEIQVESRSLQGLKQEKKSVHVEVQGLKKEKATLMVSHVLDWLRV
jgi:uncharacterized coiled-coil DUF342 family protein